MMTNILISCVVLWMFSFLFVTLDDLVDFLIEKIRFIFGKKIKLYYTKEQVNLFADLKNTPLRDLYLKIYRFFLHIVEFPEDSCRQIKWAYQRVVRGWDDRACWSIDHYLCKIMIPILKQYKKGLHGYPALVMKNSDKLDKHGNPTEETDELCEKRWKEIIDGLIDMFEVAKNVNDKHWFVQDSKTYSKKLSDRHRKINRELKKEHPYLYDENFGKVLTKKECIKYEKNWDNFRKLINCLWN